MVRAVNPRRARWHHSLALLAGNGIDRTGPEIVIGYQEEHLDLTHEIEIEEEPLRSLAAGYIRGKGVPGGEDVDVQSRAHMGLYGARPALIWRN